jgi:hypothetical protein
MMGLMYAWATKEYLLERMSFGQITMYLNYGLQIKYPKTDGRADKPVSMVGKSAEEIRARRDELRRQYGTDVEGL